MNIENYLMEKDFTQIPFSWQPTEFYKISFEGWGKFTFTLDDPTLLEMVHMAARTLDSFIQMYKDDRVFTQPQLSWKPDGTFSIQIGTLEKDEYERRNTSK